MSKDNTSGLSPTKYIQQVRTELKKVSWPDREETTNMTLLVIVTSVIVALYLGGLDYLFTRLISAII